MGNYHRTGHALLAAILIVCSVVLQARPVKVACVGNSVTYGYGLEGRDTASYPARLAAMLGEGYEVRNFGKSGATLLNRGHRPYTEQAEYREALDFAGDVVVIHLGLNDTDPRDWPDYRDDFMNDYRALIHSFRQANPDCKIWICRMTPIFHTHPRFKSGTHEWYGQVQAAIGKVARTGEVGLIDLNSELCDRPDLFADAVHPDAEGAAIIARKVYRAVTGDFGGLALPAVYTDNMVLQRGATLQIKGTADVGQRVTVRLGRWKGAATVGADGKWEVGLTDVTAGGPYELSVSTSKRKLRFTNVMTGEVWLCSGQSNMAFTVGETVDAKEAVQQAVNPNLRLFDMKPRAYTDAVSWDTATLASLNRMDYYLPAQWEEAVGSKISGFSAVAYYFGRMLADSLQVPVGLICNAVGGAPAEAFTDRKTLENDPALVDILYDWMHNDAIQGWVRERAALNIRAAKAAGYQRHPYEPCYLYETGIRPLEEFTIKGVIWYQGESNAHNAELHEAIFPALVSGWRKVWGAELPFYFVQLSSLNRPSWPCFRNSQRMLAQAIPVSGMAVTSDVGDPGDVHPKNKRPVGERLARLALNGAYGMDRVVPAGPLYKNVVFDAGAAWLEFNNARGMKSSDGQPLRAFEIAGEDGLFVEAVADIVDEKIKVSSPAVQVPRYVRYGWQPYTTANLVNGAGLPASTFKTEDETL